ncbi:hypothetical protein J3R80_09280 [Aliiroseovarius sp. Z3]|uniref:hypothetical protein n=1 Tax=Aliiroseovarius sp. Z3 TaxID=2811402 RepID=UPI0023B26664|nr:hypothetical protein [Aliiroseovarius sp. Z3]MDE9450653.1 hypothetical protein [Aliiroseovarius sp. Z3]
MGKLFTPILLLLAGSLLAACMKQQHDHSPFPEFLICTGDQEVGAYDILRGFYLRFDDPDVLYPAEYAPMSFKRDLGWGVDLDLSNSKSGVARFDIKVNGDSAFDGEEPPSRLTITRQSDGAFSLLVDYPSNSGTGRGSSTPIPCSTKPEAAYANP